MSRRRAITYADLELPYLEHLEEVGSLGRRKRRLTPATLRGYRCVLRDVVAVWGPRAVERTTPADLDRYELELRRRGLSTSSIRHRLDRIEQLHRFAVRRGDIPAAPCEVERPALVLRSRPARTSEEALSAALREARAAGDVRLERLLLLTGDGGLRREEALRLEWSDVDLEAGAGESWYGAVHVAVRGEEYRTKSARGRTVPILTRRLAAALAPARFAASRGRVLSSLSCVDSLSRIATGAGVHLHELRRRFASRLAETGTPVPKIRLWLGHASLETTQRYVLVDEAPVTRLLRPGEALEGPTSDRSRETVGAVPRGTGAA